MKWTSNSTHKPTKDVIDTYFNWDQQIHWTMFWVFRKFDIYLHDIDKFASARGILYLVKKTFAITYLLHQGSIDKEQILNDR